MALLVVLLPLSALAIVAVISETDTSDARSESARPPAGWWPAGR